VIMATINYFGLTKKGTVTVNLTVTIDQLITAIATDEVLATEYYTVSAMNDFSKSSLTYGDSSTTLTQLGLVDGGTVLCTTNQTGSRQERQVAKLAIAGKKRSLTGRNSTLVIDNLPTKYTGNAVTNNANADGLVAGRPWSSTPLGDVDLYGFFENQLIGGTYMTFSETISGVQVDAITTNFNGNPTNGSYMKVNGVLIAGDQFGTAPDGTNTTLAPFQMTRGHTITIIDPATGLSRSGFPKCYDTYGGAGLAASPTAGIADDIKNAAANDIIAMGTYDATSVSAAMRSAMNTYTGSTSTNTWSAVRISHMFLAKRNSTP
jgi:hypothetical protein